MRHGRHFGGPPHRAFLMGGPPGPGGPFGPGPGRARGPRARRGDVRSAILMLLAEETRNGYGLMQEIEQRSGGAWRPSPGSIYPALAQLEDEGLVRTTQADGRKLYELTDDGRAELAARDERRPAPWEQAAPEVDDASAALMEVARQVGMAVTQVASAGTAAQRTAAADVLAGARRALYGILAEDEPAGDTADV